MKPKQRTFRSWDGLISAYRNGASSAWAGWMFRGQRQATWDLQPSLERAVVKRFERRPEDMPGIEARLLRDFQRQAHQFIDDPPERKAQLEWLALMQHWGAPTRMLDWTYSFYAAAFFAVADAVPGDKIAIWAIDYRWLRRRAWQIARESREGPLPNSLNHLPFDRPSIRAVVPSTPFRLHERLVVQQGTFLVPGDLSVSFMENFAAMNDGDGKVRAQKLCLEVSKGRLERALHDLRRMNLTYASLFPGLDGFAKHGANIIPDLAGMPVSRTEW